MDISPEHMGKVSALPPNNPTDSQRYEMLYNSLALDGRPEDFQNIIRLLAPPSDITRYGAPGEFKNLKVGIIGGGLAGMSAAFELRKLGFDITVFESTTERIGGRVYTYYFDKDKRLYGELGAGRIPASHETVWHYINLFKLNTEAMMRDPNTFTFVRKVRVRNNPESQNIFHSIYPKFDLTIQEANTPWPMLYDQVSRYYLSTMPPEVRKQFLMALPRYDYRYESVADINSRQAMQRYGLSDEAINMIASVIPARGALIFHSYEGTLSEEYSMDASNTYRITGGMVNLPLAFYKSLTSPNPIEYPDIPQNARGRVNWKGGYLVTGIFKSDTGGKVTLGYRNIVENDNHFENFDYVICTVPFPVLRQMTVYPFFSGRKVQAIREVYYEDAQKTLFLCKERFWEKQGIFQGTSYTDEVIQLISYPPDRAYCTQNSVNCPSDEPGVLLASYNIARDASSLGNIIPPFQHQIIKSKVEEVHGLPMGYLDNIVTNAKTVDWVSEPWFYGAFQFFLPGQKKDFLYVSTIPEYDNRVFFAGEHTSTKNGWIQGALQSGIAAANDTAYYSLIHKYQR